jgi:hypothetical protein
MIMADSEDYEGLDETVAFLESQGIVLAKYNPESVLLRLTQLVGEKVQIDSVVSMLLGSLDRAEFNKKKQARISADLQQFIEEGICLQYKINKILENSNIYEDTHPPTSH